MPRGPRSVRRRRNDSLAFGAGIRHVGAPSLGVLCMRLRSLVLVFALLLPVFADAAELKIATWNLDWLTTRRAGERGLPPDLVTRSDGDFARLAAYAEALNADVVAIQEVDGFSAATKVFPKDKYSIHMTRDRVTQRVGIVVRRGLSYDVHPDLVALGENHLRSGADITLHIGGRDLRVLAVHLKKGCQVTPMARARSPACQDLRDQIGPLAGWIAERKQEGMPFIILGDFNRWMTPKDSFLAALQKAAPMVRATEGRSSPCWGAENFIDHILAGGPAARWIRPDTLRVLIYQETEESWKDRLSDHCPVSVRVAVPD
jgi:endonuclease/exonuclease/phosphatase family metal-dependent hydrolase